MSAIPSLPVKVRCSQNLKTLAPKRSTGLLWIDEGIDCPWMAWDSADFRNTLLHDIDHPEALARWQDLPPHIRPILCMSPWTGRAVAITRLADPVALLDERRAKSRAMADLAARLMAAALGATVLPVGSVVKNPFGTTANIIGHLPRIGTTAEHPELRLLTEQRGLVWHTLPGGGPVELKEIVAALKGQYWFEPEARSRVHQPGPGGGKARPDPREISNGRNDELFHTLRFWAMYQGERDLAATTDQALRINAGFTSPLSAAEVTATARSVAKFMTTKYRPRHGAGRVRRGRDAPLHSPSMTLTEKQAVAGAETAQARTLATLTTLAEAATGLFRDGQRPSQTAIAAASGLTVRRVKELWNVAGLPVSYGVLSGSGAAGGGQGGPFLTLKGYCGSLSRKIEENARAAAAIRSYDEQAARMSRRGARPEEVAPPASDADPAIMAAWRRAVAARRDAVRRATNRAKAIRQAMDRAERWSTFLSLARAGDEAGYRAWMRQETARWDDLADAVARDDESRRSLRDRRGIHFARLAREWRAAKQAAATGHDQPLRQRRRAHTGRTDWHRLPDRHDLAAHALTRHKDQARQADRDRELRATGWLPDLSGSPSRARESLGAVLPT